jgi:hypothetical protein
MRYTHLWEDDEGESHFADEELPLTPRSFAPPAPPFDVSAPWDAERVVFIHEPPGWFGDWHPVPHVQFFLGIAGEIEVQVSDGEIRRFGAGSVVLTTDTTGKGHTTRVVSAEPARAAFVQLAPLPPA